ncbi:hypothetical protein OIDMADRAFT_60943 [Oidiodendron maius Zn]|uniref:Uncharacterized protein n=1 Tax=Oidiodendron maius (strain Zn) TaxID=913774 RepID=A0A0C3C5H1_OIDMZ|nr:hypothetical protein OIDMADRAFT_60943 [Oidiodendron maius Zn]
MRNLVIEVLTLESKFSSDSSSAFQEWIGDTDETKSTKDNENSFVNMIDCFEGANGLFFATQLSEVEFIRAGFNTAPMKGDLIRANYDTVQTRDLICIILGCPAPIVLRPIDHYYKVVGEAYVPGIMNGSAMEKLRDGAKRLEYFELI